MNDATKNKFAAIYAAALAAAEKKSQMKDSPAPAAKQAAQLPTSTTPPAAPKMPEVKIFDNLSDLEKAANNGETVSIMNMYELVNKKPATAPKVQDRPELSNMNFADLIPDAPAAPKQEEAPAAKPQPAATPAPAVPNSKKIGNVEIKEYSEKSFAVQGETTPIRIELKKLGGKFNYYLKGGPGWIFAKPKYYTVKIFLEKISA